MKPLIWGESKAEYFCGDVWTAFRARRFFARRANHLQATCKPLERDETPMPRSQRRFSSINQSPQIERRFEPDDRGEDGSRAERAQCTQAELPDHAAMSVRGDRVDDIAAPR